MQMTLQEFMTERELTQAEIAEMFGLSQSAISQMLKAGRNIVIEAEADGTIQAKEIRRIGNFYRQEGCAA